MRLLACVALLLACDPSPPEAPVDDEAPAGATQSAEPDAVAPPEAAPAPEDRAVDRLPATRLPVSRRAGGRPTSAKNRMQVLVLSGRPDSATVVLPDAVIEDMRDEAARRRMVWWMARRQMDPIDDWESEPRGWAIAAEGGVSASIVAELIGWASGTQFEDPVEVLLRTAGTSSIIAVPVTLAEEGLAPTGGSWGEWAHEIDAAPDDTPVPLALDDLDDQWRFRESLVEYRPVVSIDRIEPENARRLVMRHLEQMQLCQFSAWSENPDAVGTFTLVLERSRRGRVIAASSRHDPRLAPAAKCVAKFADGWRVPAGTGAIELDITSAIRHVGPADDGRRIIR
jgi:hypothetical protein